MIKAGIIGATGYAGNELVRLLMGHKEVEIKWYGSRSYIDQKYAEVYQNMFEIVDDVCMDDNMEALAEQVDVIFTATPQGFLAGVLNHAPWGGLIVLPVVEGRIWYFIAVLAGGFVTALMVNLLKRNYVEESAGNDTDLDDLDEITFDEL